MKNKTIEKTKTMLQRAKGMRDFTPKEVFKRQEIIRKLQEVFESFGYNPLETPIIERYDLFASKFSQGKESDAMMEAFKFKDQGNRDLILRTEFTVSLGRFVGMNLDMKMPFKRYQIGQIFRDGPIKTGRYREFWQCDADIVGSKNMLADAEIIQIAKIVFQKLNLDVEIRINNRKILNRILEIAGVTEDLREPVIISIDKLDKIGVGGVEKELLAKKINGILIKKILDFVNISGKNEEKIEKLEKILGESKGLEEIKETMSYLPCQDDVVFLPSLARGLAYYTGNVFEVFLKNKDKFSSSLAGGGRFDKMIGGFLQSNKEYPAVGISFGLETIFDAYNLDKKEQKNNVVKVFVIPIGRAATKEVFLISKELREAGINADMDLMARNLRKNLAYVSNLKIKYALLVGEKEIKSQTVVLRNMETGEQIEIERGNLVDKLNRN